MGEGCGGVRDPFLLHRVQSHSHIRTRTLSVHLPCDNYLYCYFQPTPWEVIATPVLLRVQPPPHPTPSTISTSLIYLTAWVAVLGVRTRMVPYQHHHIPGYCIYVKAALLWYTFIQSTYRNVRAPNLSTCKCLFCKTETYVELVQPTVHVAPSVEIFTRAMRRKQRQQSWREFCPVGRTHFKILLTQELIVT